MGVAKAGLNQRLKVQRNLKAKMNKELVLATITEIVRNMDLVGDPRDQLIQALIAHGFACARECQASYYRRDGRRVSSRIDIRAGLSKVTVGIEIDNCSPRDRSVQKLRGCQVDLRIIVLRKVKRQISAPRRIDALLIIGSPLPIGANPEANVNGESAKDHHYGLDNKGHLDSRKNPFGHQIGLSNGSFRGSSLGAGSTRGIKLRRGAGGRKNGVALSEGHRPYPRTKPTYAYRVEVVELVIPDWARAKSIPALSQSENHVWLRSRTLAYRLARMDRESGGTGRVDRMEVRRCQVCGRYMVGIQAERRRLQDEAGYGGRKTPCDEECHQRRQEGRPRGIRPSRARLTA